MTTKTQVIRKNLTGLAEVLNSEAGFPLKKLKIKAIGGDKYSVNYGDTYINTVDGEDCFAFDGMNNLCISFIESITELDPDYAGNGGNRGGNHSVYGEDNLERVSENEIHKIDCRMMNYDESEVNLFWQTDAIDFIPERIKEIESGKHNLSVYAYKGKYWYVALNIANICYEVYSLDEEREICYESCEEVNVLCYASEETLKVASEIAEFIKSSKDDLELRCISAQIKDKVLSLGDFFESFDYDSIEESILDNLEVFVFEYYKQNTPKGWQEQGFLGAILNPEENENIYNFIAKHYPELKIVNQSKMEKFAKKFGFSWSFDFYEVSDSFGGSSTTINGSIKFKKIDSNEHYHISSDEFIECDKDWKTAFKDVIQDMITKRMIEKTKKAIQSKLSGNIIEVSKNIWVSFKDSIDSGNCLFGTNQFIQRNNINLNEIGGVRGDALLEMEDSEYTRRIIYMKAANDTTILKMIGM